MSKAKKLARKLGVIIIGFPLLVIGIILIPLPGPGLVVCFLALLILAAEFEWASRHRDNIQARLKHLMKSAKKKVEEIEDPDDKSKEDPEKTKI